MSYKWVRFGCLLHMYFFKLIYLSNILPKSDWTTFQHVTNTCYSFMQVLVCHPAGMVIILYVQFVLYL